jgi:hypothetical protein
MNINSVNPVGKINSTAGTDKINSRKSSKEAKQDTKHINDEYIPSQEKQKKITYEKPLPAGKDIDIQKLKEESERAYSHLRELVSQLLKQQGIKSGEAGKIEIPEEVRLEAQSLVADGGELSAENVSGRIVDFAKALSGGDKEKIELLRNAIIEGFGEAKRILGGELPEVSNKTYDLVMEKLDDWASENND